MGVSQKSLTPHTFRRSNQQKRVQGILEEVTDDNQRLDHSGLFPSCRDTIKIMLYSRNFSLLEEGYFFFSEVNQCKIDFLFQKRKTTCSGNSLHELQKSWCSTACCQFPSAVYDDFPSHVQGHMGRRGCAVGAGVPFCIPGTVWWHSISAQ